MASPSRNLTVSSSPSSPPLTWFGSPRSSTDTTSRPRRSLLSAHFSKKAEKTVQNQCAEKTDGIRDMVRIFHTSNERRKGEGGVDGEREEAEEEEEEEEEDDDEEEEDDDEEEEDDDDNCGNLRQADVSEMPYGMEQTTDEEVKDDEGGFGDDEVHGILSVNMDHSIEHEADDGDGKRGHRTLQTMNVAGILPSMEEKTDDDNAYDERVCKLFRTADMAQTRTLVDLKVDGDDGRADEETVDMLKLPHMMEQKKSDDGESTHRVLQTVAMAEIHNTEETRRTNAMPEMQNINGLLQTTAMAEMPNVTETLQVIAMTGMLDHSANEKNTDEGGGGRREADRISGLSEGCSRSWELFDEPGTPPEVVPFCNLPLLPPPVSPKKSSNNRIIPLGKHRPRKLLFAGEDDNKPPDQLQEESMDILHGDSSAGLQQAHQRIFLAEDVRVNLRQRPVDLQETVACTGKQSRQKLSFDGDETSEHQKMPLDIARVDRYWRSQCHERILLDEDGNKHANLHPEPIDRQETRLLASKQQLLFSGDKHANLHQEPINLQEIRLLESKHQHRDLLFSEVEPSAEVQQVHMDLQESRSLNRQEQHHGLFKDEHNDLKADLHQWPTDLQGSRSLDLHQLPTDLQETKPFTGKQQHRNLVLSGDGDHKAALADVLQQPPKGTRTSSSSSSSFRVIQLR